MNFLRSSHRRWWRVSAAAVLVVAAAVVATTAFATAKPPTLNMARVHLTGPSGSRTQSIAVTGRGVTVYWLGGESTHHLLCTSTACLKFWPPVKVPAGSKVTAAGFKANLGTLRRGGFTQLTLNGHPVYTFLQDGGKRGVATGDGVNAFGGIWHVFKEGGAGAAAAPPSPGASSQTSSPYPAY